MAKLQKQRRRGSILLEFALAAAFVLIPLALGTATVGMTLVRTIRVYHINRDAGHMFARGVDFSLAVNRNLLLRLAQGLNITDNGGNGVIIMSAISSNEAGQLFCTRRLVIGNAALRTSSFANPKRVDSSGNVDASAGGASAEAFRSVLPMNPNDTAFVTETYFKSPEYDWGGVLLSETYTRAVF